MSRPVNALLSTLAIPFSVSPEVCAEYMIWALLNGEKGAFRRNDKGDDIGTKNYYGSDEARAKVWEHTEQEIKRALETES